MFTGIVEEMGTIRKIEMKGTYPYIDIQAEKVLSDMKIGDSVSINGVCLTVIYFDGNSFKVEVMPETLRQTGLSLLKRGDRINLERALSLKDRLGGHLVTGHVDALGRILKKYPEGNAQVLEIESPPEVLKYVIPKGSIAIDGISLTVAGVKESGFTVSLIPHTAEYTTLSFRERGDYVNLEGDLIGKYVERFVSGVKQQGDFSKDLTMKDLLEKGFL
ncbi:MAG: riboflavin synthase [Candidatus Syntrophonatronum acetioxidans]|uniref:Riboflavin synthase n=1 Tax=Candidatus Syntrophonatronum acetioxidans TaxID=1795816 RepID=A0A424YHT3_9FIRM|nr:MAG: riboflavin synthase [Candidatus Syntrophonatronum acetioxidans]